MLQKQQNLMKLIDSLYACFYFIHFQVIFNQDTKGYGFQCHIFILSKFKFHIIIKDITEVPMQEAPQLGINQHIITNFSGFQTSKVTEVFLGSEAFACKYDPNDDFIAFGCNNGTKILYSTKEKRITATVQCPLQQPATCVKWRPTVNTKIKVLGVTNTLGVFDYLHVPSMKKLFSIEEKDNSLHCCDFSHSGQHFATAGRDAHIRIYDQNTKSVSTDLGCAQWNNRGHSNRIFSVKFIDDNTIISGGWDSVVHLWDIREGKSVRSVFGPHVAGDSIDYNKGQILIGCYAAKNQIQIWDYNKFTLREGITWASPTEKDKVAYVYTSSFANFEDDTIVAGACGVNEVKVFRKKQGSYQMTSLIQGLSTGCFSVDSSFTHPQFVFTTAKDGMFVYSQHPDQ